MPDVSPPASVRERTTWVLALACGLVSALASVWIATFGVRWDEHFLAFGGHLLASGVLPYRDYGLPIGPVPLLIQGLGGLFSRTLFWSAALGPAIASLVCVGLGAWWFRRTFRDAFSTVCFAIALHFAFVGGAGSLWYNQSAAMFVSVGLLFAAADPGRFSWRSAASGVALGVAFLCKQDGPLIALGLLAPWLLWSTRGLGAPLALVSGFVLAVVGVLGGWQVLVGGAPFERVNLLVNGYESRLAPLADATVRRAKLALFETGRYVTLFLAAGAAFFWPLWRVEGDGGTPRAWSGRLLALVPFVVAVVVAVTSGRGAGFVGSPYVPVLVLVGLGAGLDVRLLRVLTCTLALVPAWIAWTDVTKVRTVDMPADSFLAGYAYSPETRQLFLDFERVVHEQARPGDTIFTGGVFQFAHPSLRVELAGGPLWVHSGVTSKAGELCDLVARMEASPPTWLVDPFVGESSVRDERWGACRPAYERFLARSTVVAEGFLDTIGTGGHRNLVRIHRFGPVDRP